MCASLSKRTLIFSYNLSNLLYHTVKISDGDLLKVIKCFINKSANKRARRGMDDD